MTKWVIEADGEIVGETADAQLAEAMYDAARSVYDVVTMHSEELPTCH